LRAFVTQLPIISMSPTQRQRLKRDRRPLAAGFGAGTAVTVYDSSGAVVAVSQLGRGSGSYSSGCRFSFSVPDVPTGERFYQVEISHRGKMNLTADEAEAGSAAWSLGGS
jgi:hypothetical protein